MSRLLQIRHALFALLLAIPSFASAEESDVAAPRTKVYPWMTLEKWRWFHEGDLERGVEGPVEVLFLGDSITEAWEKNGAAVWDKSLAPLGAANFGIGGDTTQNVLWRITDGGSLDKIRPSVVVLMIGTNNIGLHNDNPETVLRGIAAIVKALRKKLPEADILLLDLFPRGVPGDSYRKSVEAVNRGLDDLVKGKKKVHRLRIWDEFTDGKGNLPAAIMPDKLHLSEKGYEIWAKAMAPTLRELIAD